MDSPFCSSCDIEMIWNGDWECPCCGRNSFDDDDEDEDYNNENN